MAALTPEEIYRRYGASILRRCRGLLGHAGDDAAQEVFVTIMHKLRQVRDRERLGPWVYQLTTRHCLNQLRAQRRRSQREEHEAVAVWQDVPSADPYQDCVAKDLLHQVTAGLDDLSQQVFVYRYFDGMTLDEIAAVTGRSVRTITSRLRKLEAHLGARLGVGGTDLRAGANPPADGTDRRIA